jgi:hypothetical protein
LLLRVLSPGSRIQNEQVLEKESAVKRKQVSSVILAAVLCISGTVFAACPSADMTEDCRVDFADFAVFAEQWVTAYDPNDLAVVAEQWLTEGIPADPGVMAWVSINDPGVLGHEWFNGQMSKYETTNAQYCQYLNFAKGTGDVVVNGTLVKGANGSNSGADYVNTTYYDMAGAGYGGAARINYDSGTGIFSVDIGFEDHPVNCVNWYGATAYCNFYGWRLPTTWEWQAVADYTGNFIYGCGETINASMANYDVSVHPYGTTAVGAFGTYGYGMCDMAGNVQEWTSTVTGLGTIILRGGNFYSGVSYCAVSSQLTYQPGYIYSFFGFRVCR